MGFTKDTVGVFEKVTPEEYAVTVVSPVEAAVIGNPQDPVASVTQVLLLAVAGSLVSPSLARDDSNSMETPGSGVP